MLTWYKITERVGVMYKGFIKRVADFLLAFIGLVILALPLVIMALIIKLGDGGPAIFKQKRLGLGGREFTFYKFRSMRVNSEKTGSGVYSGKDDDRVTGIGKILRATSIDELPQLVNVLRGDMSFVGPRPPLTYHPWPLAEYTDEQKRMFEVRPGITGWAQVNGRKGVEWNKRIELNIWYVDNCSFLLDVKILFKTVAKVFSNADNLNTGATVVTYEQVPAEETVKGESVV